VEVRFQTSDKPLDAHFGRWEGKRPYFTTTVSLPRREMRDCVLVLTQEKAPQAEFYEALSTRSWLGMLFPPDPMALIMARYPVDDHSERMGMVQVELDDFHLTYESLEMVYYYQKQTVKLG